jgi:hypothetical protein
MSINKSQVSRDFWRNVIDNNKIDLNNQDARKSIVNEFLNNPENKKAGWKKNDRRFFRLSFDKICKERGVSPLDFGVKPEPKRIKTQVGKMNFSVTTKEKKLHPILKDENEKEEPEKEKLPNSKELEEQRQQAAAASNYSAQSVAGVFAMMFNILHARFPACTPLTNQEMASMGEAWEPIFNEYLGDKGGKWVMPILVTAPIVIVRFSQYQRVQKEKEIEEEILKDMPQEKPQDKPDDNNKNDKKWSDHL